MSTQPKIIKKLSVKTVCGKIIKNETPEGVKFALKDDAGAIKEVGPEGRIMRIVGNISGYSTGEGTFGPWVALKGVIGAENLVTGEKFRSTKCFLPETGSDMVFNALCQDGARAVEFAYDIVLKNDEQTAVGYQYDLIPLVEAVAESDPLTALMARISMQALSAPKEEAPKEEAPKKEESAGKKKAA